MKILRNIFLSLALLAFASCEDPSNDYLWNDKWNENTPDSGSGSDDQKPEEEKPEEKPEVKTGKARLVWIDAAANFKDYANSKKNIADDMARLKETGFTGVIVEVNEELADSPENLNSDPYGSWIIKVENITEPEQLLDAAAYEAFCAEEG